MSHLTASGIADLGIAHGFFTREDGFSEGVFSSRNVKMDIGDSQENVLKNRDTCIKELTEDDTPLVYAKLCHGDSIYEVDTPITENLEVDQYDAIICTQKHVAIGLATADCVPVLLAASDRSLVAVVHAGWRGLASGVIEKTIQRIAGIHAVSRSDLVAAVGPSIAQMSYEVGAEVAGQFNSQYTLQKDGSLFLDLFSIAEDQLRAAGIEHLEVVRIDTATDDRFYSYRAENGQTGRQLTAIVLP